MKKKLSLFFIIAILSILVAACGGNKDAAEESTGAGTEKETVTEEMTITHQLGETTVKKNPENVVVFDFGVLDSLDKLGVIVKGVPQATIPTYLEKYASEDYANVGSLKELDMEKISEIAPDLIIISTRQQDYYEELSEIAPTIFMALDTTRYMDSYTENMTTLGEIFGKESEVETELATVKESVAALKEKASATGKNALVILANEGNISAYGPGSRFGLIHDEFGFTAVDENLEVSTHGQNISPEYIVEKDPDYLFVIDRGAAVGGQSSAESIVENELVKNTKAYKEGHIVYLDPNYWYLSGGGLVSVAEMVKEVEAGIK